MAAITTSLTEIRNSSSDADADLQLRSHPTLFSAIDTVLTGCTLALSSLDTETGQLTTGAHVDELFFAATAVTWPEAAMTELLQHLRDQRTALATSAQILQNKSCASPSEYEDLECSSRLRDNESLFTKAAKSSNALRAAYPGIKAAAPVSVLTRGEYKETAAAAAHEKEEGMKTSETVVSVLSQDAGPKDAGTAVNTDTSTRAQHASSPVSASNGEEPEETLQGTQKGAEFNEQRHSNGESDLKDELNNWLSYTSDALREEQDHLEIGKDDPANGHREEKGKGRAEEQDVAEESATENSISATTPEKTAGLEAQPGLNARDEEEAPPPLPPRPRPAAGDLSKGLTPPNDGLSSSDIPDGSEKKKDASDAAAATTSPAAAAAAASPTPPVLPSRPAPAPPIDPPSTNTPTDNPPTTATPAPHDTATHTLWRALLASEQAYTTTLARLLTTALTPASEKYPALAPHLAPTLELVQEILDLNNQHVLEPLREQLSTRVVKSELLLPAVMRTWFKQAGASYSGYAVRCPHAIVAWQEAGEREGGFGKWAKGVVKGGGGLAVEEWVYEPLRRVGRYCEVLEELEALELEGRREQGEGSAEVGGGEGEEGVLSGDDGRQQQQQAVLADEDAPKRAPPPRRTMVAPYLKRFRRLRDECERLRKEAADAEELRTLNRSRIQTINADHARALDLTGSARRIVWQGLLACRAKGKGLWFQVHCMLLDNYLFWGRVEKPRDMWLGKYREGGKMWVLEAVSLFQFRIACLIMLTNGPLQPMPVTKLRCSVPEAPKDQVKASILDHVPRGSDLFPFTVQTDEARHSLSATTREERLKWINVIKSLCN